MEGYLKTTLTRVNVLQPVNWMAAGYIIIAIMALDNYVSLQSLSFILGLGAVLFILKNDSPGKQSSRYAWITMVFVLITFLVPVKTMLYFTICFALLFFRERFYGKTVILVPFIILLAAPAFQYVVSIFSFPVRMQLTWIAGEVFSALGHAVQVQGNVIIHEGNEFSVDPACMGLNMMTTSVLAGVILLAFYQSKLKRSVRDWQVLLFLAVIILLNIIANLFRIILLVHFQIMPGTLSHDIAGIGCLLVYVFIPAIWLAAYITRRSAPKDNATVTTQPGRNFSYKTILFHLVLLCGVSLLAWKVENADTFRKFKIPSQQQFAGHSLTNYAPGIIKLENGETLIYVKYIRGFYDTEHNPMICWAGSGYEFGKIVNEQIGDRKVLTATLTNGNDKLYSAWWYDNGKRGTSDQFEWRWDLVRGADHYVVVNVTCSAKEKLNTEVQKLINQQTLSPFFKN